MKMFNQQKYVNDYIKDNYKTVKFRIRNDEKLIINQLNKVDNITQYLKDLILKDIYENINYHYIDDSIKIDFELTIKIKMRDLVEKAEEADLLDDYGTYMNVVYAIDSQGKKEATHHIITETQWMTLLRRYRL